VESRENSAELWIILYSEFRGIWCNFRRRKWTTTAEWFIIYVNQKFPLTAFTGQSNTVTKYLSVPVPVLSPYSLLKFIAKIRNYCDNKTGGNWYGLAWNQLCRKIHGFSTHKNIFNSSTGVKAISWYTTSLVRDCSKLLFRVVETLAAVIWNSYLIGWGLKSLGNMKLFSRWAQC
jgi:hypothetical protein